MLYVLDTMEMREINTACLCVGKRVERCESQTDRRGSRFWLTRGWCENNGAPTFAAQQMSATACPENKLTQPHTCHPEMAKRLTFLDLGFSSSSWSRGVFNLCTDTIRQILEQCQEWKTPCYVNFIDFEKVFDIIHRESLVYITTLRNSLQDSDHHKDAV